MKSSRAKPNLIGAQPAGSTRSELIGAGQVFVCFSAAAVYNFPVFVKIVFLDHDRVEKKLSGQVPISPGPSLKPKPQLEKSVNKSIDTRRNVLFIQ